MHGRAHGASSCWRRARVRLAALASPLAGPYRWRGRRKLASYVHTRPRGRESAVGDAALPEEQAQPCGA